MAHTQYLTNFLDELGPKPNKAQAATISILLILSFAGGIIYSQSHGSQLDAPTNSTQELDNPCYNQSMNFTEVPPCNNNSEASNSSVNHSINKREED